MEHEHIRDLFLKYIDKETTAEENEKITEHLNNCNECRQEYEELKTVLSLFNTLEPMEPPEDLKKSIMVKVRNESPSKPWFSSIKNRWISLGATAAIICIIIGTVSMSDLLNNPHYAGAGYRSDPVFRQAEVMPEGFAVEADAIDEVINAARVENMPDMPVGAAGGAATAAPIIQGEIADIGASDIIDESEELVDIPPSMYDGNFQDVDNREVIYLTVTDMDTSLEYIKNLLGDTVDTVIVHEREQEATILAWVEKDEAQLMESLGALGIIELDILPSAVHMGELQAFGIEREILMDAVEEDLYDDEQNNRLQRDPENIEYQAAEINPFEIEDRVMYEIRISVQQE